MFKSTKSQNKVVEKKKTSIVMSADEAVKSHEAKRKQELDERMSQTICYADSVTIINNAIRSYVEEGDRVQILGTKDGDYVYNLDPEAVKEAEGFGYKLFRTDSNVLAIKIA